MKNYLSDRSNQLGQLKFILSAMAIFMAVAPTAAISSDRQFNSLTLKSVPIAVKITKKDKITNPKGKLPAADGVYLYGQSSESNQLGQQYMVFEMQQGKVTGAFYLPQSEFSCFQGSLNSHKLSVTVAGDDNSEADSAQVAAVGTSPIEDSYDRISSPYAVGLQNYYQLSNISDNDRRILSVCQQNYQQ